MDSLIAAIRTILMLRPDSPASDVQKSLGWDTEFQGVSLNQIAVVMEELRKTDPAIAALGILAQYEAPEGMTVAQIHAYLLKKTNIEIELATLETLLDQLVASPNTLAQKVPARYRI